MSTRLLTEFSTNCCIFDLLKLTMIHYQFYCKSPHKHFISIELTVESKNKASLIFQLPAWRPGRYELANFSKNIKSFHAFDENNSPLQFEKVTKDAWQVFCEDASAVTLKYTYYANVLDAGSSYLDEQQLYVNPVNCCMYVVGRENERCCLTLNIPDNFQVACGLKRNSSGQLIAENFDQLAESPLIASSDLMHDEYCIDNISFHLWIQGKCNPDFEKVKQDFIAFTKTQIEHFDSFPVQDYHFLFQITPYKSYHGVEHTNSTVILMGNNVDVFESMYDNILGICSHELYHTWNIKAVRPKTMLPYDYTQENYSRLGYVAEGVTTYMGDLMLKKSKVFGWEKFLKTQNDNLKRHFENEGRHNMSLADSAFDTWLDGYQLGIPNKKTSIYADGALCMLMIDLFIIDNTKGKQSLSTIMNKLYVDYRHHGYTENDFIGECLKLGGETVNIIFKEHIYGTRDYTASLKKALSVVGIDLVEKQNPSITAQQFGFFSTIENGKHIIKKVQDNSISDLNKVVVGDEILTINNIDVSGKQLDEVLNQRQKKISMQIKKRFKTLTVNLNAGNYYPIFVMKLNEKPSEKQSIYRKIWAN